MWIVVLALLIGIVGGVLAGLFGIGGGVVIVPALLALGLSQREASGTSLAALVLPVGIFGVIEYARRGEVRFAQAALLAVGLAIGALVGAHFAGQVSNANLQRAFGALLLVIGLRLVLLPG